MKKKYLRISSYKINVPPHLSTISFVDATGGYRAGESPGEFVTGQIVSSSLRCRLSFAVYPTTHIRRNDHLDQTDQSPQCQHALGIQPDHAVANQ